jgi:acetylornithine deacetylase
MAVNAIEAAGRLIARVADEADQWRDHEPRWPGFDVPYSTASVGVVHGGIADNVVPEDCHFHYEIRNLPGTDADALHAGLVAHARELEGPMKAVDAATGIRFETICAIPAFKARDDEPAVQLVQGLLGTPARTLVAFGTEAGLFHRAGISTVVCGPGSIQQAHQPDEYVSLEQLAACEAMLQRLG